VFFEIKKFSKRAVFERLDKAYETPSGKRKDQQKTRKK